MILKLQEGCWYADGEGDPPRTLVKANAKNFELMSDALAALDKARKFRRHVTPEPFPGAEIQHD